MGYTTDFSGSINIEPPLNQKEIDYLNTFFQARHDKHNDTMSPQPKNFTSYGKSEEKFGPWCDLVISDDGKELLWNGAEKSYNMSEWVTYIIEHFIGDNPLSAQNDQAFDYFVAHTLNGELEAQGEEEDDHWYLVVKNNEVFTYDDNDYEKLQVKEDLEKNLPNEKSRLSYKI